MVRKMIFGEESSPPPPPPFKAPTLSKMSISKVAKALPGLAGGFAVGSLLGYQIAR